MIAYLIVALVAGVGIGYALANSRKKDDGRGKLRHDLRGALTPAMLAAEMLESHADPVVQQRSGTISEALGRAQQILKQDAVKK